MCKYVRRELRDLTRDDRERFLDAREIVHRMPLEEGRAKFGGKFMDATGATDALAFGLGGATDASAFGLGAPSPTTFFFFIPTAWVDPKPYGPGRPFISGVSPKPWHVDRIGRLGLRLRRSLTSHVFFFNPDSRG